MLARYTLSAMAKLWLRPETKFKYWAMVELAMLQAREEAGEVPKGLTENFRKAIIIDMYFTQRVKEIEDEVQHDMIAFVTACQEQCQKLAGTNDYVGEFHNRLTSYDTEDPALILMLRESLRLVIHELQNLSKALLVMAFRHKYTWMIGHTHGQYAEPTTLGHLLLVYHEAIERGIDDLERVMEDNLVEAKMSGAVGTYSTITPALERRALAILDLEPARVATQILQRDRMARMMAAIAVVGSSIGQMMRTFWVDMRSEIRNLQEPFGEKQKGSSTMAHKKNPIKTEQFFGMPRLLRGWLLPALEDVETYDFRDISQSSVERHIIPDALGIIHYLANKATWLVQGMTVDEANLLRWLEDAKGVWASPKLKAYLIEAGVDAEVAYRYIQQCSQAAIKEGRHLREVMEMFPMADGKRAPEIIGDRWGGLFDPVNQAKGGIDYIFSQYEPLV